MRRSTRHFVTECIQRQPVFAAGRILDEVLRLPKRKQKELSVLLDETDLTLALGFSNREHVREEGHASQLHRPRCQAPDLQWGRRAIPERPMARLPGARIDWGAHSRPDPNGDGP